MKQLVVAGLLSLACALPQGAGELSSIPIAVRSLNRSSVEVYLLCGDRDASWLGVVPGKEMGVFEVPASRTRCVEGLNFFLVSRASGRGYWVGPFWAHPGASINLTIEKYAGASMAAAR